MPRSRLWVIGGVILSAAAVASFSWIATLCRALPGIGGDAPRRDR
ncbi:hypothetical protein [Streptomyces sp. ISL-100]|nr:hypothetical protein [Streptomyces sp. ISL-100]